MSQPATVGDVLKTGAPAPVAKGPPPGLNLSECVECGHEYAYHAGRPCEHEEDRGTAKPCGCTTFRSPVRTVPCWSVPPPIDICGICAKRGYRNPVQRNRNGDPTGLCTIHNTMDAELRRRLRDAAASSPLTPETAERIRNEVLSQFRR